jgi:hypothetical protein
LSKANATQPLSAIQIEIRGTEEQALDTTSPYNDTTTKYTVIAFDAGYPGANDTNQYYLHYLENNLSEW